MNFGNFLVFSFLFLVPGLSDGWGGLRSQGLPSSCQKIRRLKVAVSVRGKISEIKIIYQVKSFSGCFKLPDFVCYPPLLLWRLLRPLGGGEVMVQLPVGLLVDLTLGARGDQLDRLGVVAGQGNNLWREG